MKSVLALLPLAAAWPQVMQMNAEIEARQALEARADPVPGNKPPPRAPLFLSGRKNTGASYPVPAPFDQQAQFVDVRPGSGHEFKAPGANDKRGQCPGLNAAANHNYLPRNGLPTIAQTVTGLEAAYNMGQDLALFLAIVSVALAGDPITQQWSIGGAFPNTLPYPATGILGTHNQYEGDASIIRGDAYLNDGQVGVFQNHKWDNLMSLAKNDRFDLDAAAAQSDYSTRYSILNNPYYFSAPFAGFVAPAAHDFVINFMSNRSAANPGGELTRDVLQQFFAVTGTPNNYKHNPGQERIPLNWYKRPGAQKYNLVDVFTDLFTNNAMYPGSLRIGGNTGKTDSFVGVELGDLSNGAYNFDNLAQGNNAVCFLFQAFSAGLPDASDPIVGLGKTLFDWTVSQLGPLASKFQCPQLTKFNSTPLFKQFPGANYKAQGQSTSFLGGLLGGALSKVKRTFIA